MLQPPLIQVSDQLERRIRRPADALRCVVACIVIVAAIVTAIAASATTAGAETDIVGASRRLPDALSNDIPQIARFGLLILPLALAVAQLVRRQVRRLIEAFATGVLAGAAAEVANILLERPAAAGDDIERGDDARSSWVRVRTATASPPGRTPQQGRSPQ